MGMIDIHTHILYGVDDGAKTLSDSMELLDEEREQGVDTVIMTPHYGPKFGYPDKEIIMEHFDFQESREVLSRDRVISWK